MSGEQRRRVVVVGASAAGLKCACRLARLQPEWHVTVVEERSVFSFAACGLPYVLSGDIDDVEQLRRTQDGALRDPQYFARVKGVDVMAGWRATRISAEDRTVEILDRGGERRALCWDDLVFACGSRPRRLPSQPDDARVRNVHSLEDVDPLRVGLSTGKIRSVVVIGAGLAGCELAEAFRSLWGASVTLVERAAWPLPELLDREAGVIVEDALTAGGVETRFGAGVDNLDIVGGLVVVAAGGSLVTADLAVVAVGTEPRTELAAAAGIAIGPTGAIAVDERMATSFPRVWAVGDCAEVRHAVTGRPTHMPFGSLANRQGRLLANVLAGRAEALPPVAGAVAVKVFDCNVGAVGLPRAVAQEAGFDAAAVWITTHDRAHYWPEARELALQLVYDRQTRRVLGVQCVGPGEAAKRIDVATQLIVRGATLAEFSHVEHAYAPPFAPALEPLAVAAFVAGNQEDGVSALSPVEDDFEARVLDVRHSEERNAYAVGGSEAVAIPLEEIRDSADRIGEGPLLVVCERGGRAAEVVRWLQTRSRPARYWGGGLRWRRVAGAGGAR